MTRERGPIDSPGESPFDDEALSRLAPVLLAEAELVEPSAGSLARIQARRGGSQSRTTWRWLAPLAAAAVVVGIASAVVLLPKGDQTTTAPPAGTVTPSLSSSPSITVSPTPSSDPSSTPKPDGTAPVVVPPSQGPGGCDGGVSAGAIYFVSDVPGVGPRLYREFTRVADCPGGALGGAVTTMLAAQPVDPDYVSLWPSSTEVLSVKRSGDTATIDLSSFPALGADSESAAVQQLVWTATAADPSIKRVQILVNGQVPQSGHSDWSSPVARDAALGTRANVWILNPSQGQSVGSPVRVTVFGTGYEGNVPLKIFQDGAEVASANVLTEQGAFREASTTFELEPGSYEVRAYNDSGQDGSLQLWDSKSFTVG